MDLFKDKVHVFVMQLEDADTGSVFERHLILPYQMNLDHNNMWKTALSNVLLFESAHEQFQLKGLWYGGCGVYGGIVKQETDTNVL